jgi:hypothetical protein
MIKNSYLQLGILVLLFVFGSIGYVFFYSIVEKQSVKAQELTKDIEIKKSSSMRDTRAKNITQQILKTESLLHTFFISSGDVVPFLTGLQSKGATLGTKIQVVSVSADTRSPSGHIVLALQIHGTFENVMRTIGVLEHESYDTEVTNLTLQNSAPLDWNATMTMVVGTVPTASTTANRMATTTNPSL